MIITFLQMARRAALMEARKQPSLVGFQKIDPQLGIFDRLIVFLTRGAAVADLKLNDMQMCEVAIVLKAARAVQRIFPHQVIFGRIRKRESTRLLESLEFLVIASSVEFC
jgi:hypothetical protein